MPAQNPNSTKETLKDLSSPGRSTQSTENLSNQDIKQLDRLKSNALTRSQGTEGEDPSAKGGYMSNKEYEVNATTGKQTKIDASANEGNKISNSTATTGSGGSTSSNNTEDKDKDKPEDKSGDSSSERQRKQEEAQKESDRAVTYSEKNKSFPYMSVLASTNFANLTPIEPLGDIKSGSERIYDVKLLDDEGIIYLRQYLSIDDEETGAVWRFQYAPQISYTRSATFQEDKSWGTNVQPSHYNNTSGKSIQIQGAILEGFTIGKTVTNMVKALEVLMSVVNPDNELQVAPYAYRLIVGSRTFKEPIADKHAPFIIESLTVKEEMYDVAGELMMARVDLSLKEVPYYQVNDGRKLLLVTKEVVAPDKEKCDAIVKEIKDLNDAAVVRRNKNKENMEAAYKGADKKAAKAAQIMVTSHKKATETNCTADSAAYPKLAKLYQEFAEYKCTGEKATEGFDAIVLQFGYKEGLYQVMKGRNLEQQDKLIGVTVFTKEGKTAGFLEGLGLLQQTALPKSPLLPHILGTEDRLPACKSIFCVSRETAGNTADDNLEKALKIAENYLNLSDVKKTTKKANSVFGSGESFAARREILGSWTTTDENNFGYNSNFIYPCGAIAKKVNLSNSGDIGKTAQSNMERIIEDNSTTDLVDFLFNDIRIGHAGAQACVCSLYILEALQNELKKGQEQKCSTEALKANNLERYKKITKRLVAIYKKALKKYPLVTGTPESELADVGKESCPNHAMGENYVDCRSAYCIAKVIKGIAKILETIGKIETGLESVTEVLK